MLYRLLAACFVLGCFTTFISLQHTQQKRILYKDALSQAYGRHDNEREQNETEGFKYKFLDPNQFGMIASRKEMIKQYYRDLMGSRPFLSHQLKRKRSHFFTDQFLLPVLYYNMGPNNLFRIFKESLVIGYSLKRSLVVPHFHHHPRMKRHGEGRRGFRETEKVVNINIFDQTYKSTFENNPKRIVDLKLLNHLLPAVTMNQFQIKCNNHLDALIVCGDLGEKRRAGLEHYKKATNVSVFRMYSIEKIQILLDQATLQNNPINLMRNLNEKKCLGLALGSHCLGSRSAWFDQWKNFSSFVRRPPETIILAKRFVATVFRNKPFLAIHWRYETKDWQDMCKSSRPETVRRVNKPTCELAIQIERNETFLDLLAVHLKTYAAKQRFHYIYFAGPPQLTPIIKKLKLKVKGLYSISDVVRFSRSNFVMEDVFENNFASSFLEQELCYMSRRFLGSPLSSWTQTVMLDRFAEDRDNHESFLELFGEDNKGFPTLRWYFPEGD